MLLYTDWFTLCFSQPTFLFFHASVPLKGLSGLSVSDLALFSFLKLSSK